MFAAQRRLKPRKGARRKSGLLPADWQRPVEKAAVNWHGLAFAEVSIFAGSTMIANGRQQALIAP